MSSYCHTCFQEVLELEFLYGNDNDIQAYQQMEKANDIKFTRNNGLGFMNDIS